MLDLSLLKTKNAEVWDAGDMEDIKSALPLLIAIAEAAEQWKKGDAAALVWALIHARDAGLFGEVGK